MTKGMKITLGFVGVAAAVGVGYMIYKKMQAPKTMNAAGPSRSTGKFTPQSSSVLSGGTRQCNRWVQEYVDGKPRCQWYDSRCQKGTMYEKECSKQQGAMYANNDKITNQ